MIKNMVAIVMVFFVMENSFAVEVKPTDEKVIPKLAIINKIDLVDELLTLLSDKEFRRTNQRSVTHVIELIGELKARQGIIALVSFLNFQTVERPFLYDGKFEYDERKIFWMSGGSSSAILKGILYRKYPALVSLVRIGEPSIEPALELLQKSKDGPTCHKIINLFYGVRGEKGLEDLKKIFSEEKDPVAKATFEEYLGYVKKENFIFPEVKKAREIRLLEEDPSQYGSPAQQYRETWQRDPIKFDEKLLPKPEPQIPEDKKSVKETDEKKSEK